MTTQTQAQFREVFRATDEWWQIRCEDFEVDDNSYVPEALDFCFHGDEAYLADCDEAFACEILSVAPEHTAIQAGDIIVSDGCGSEKIFLRRI